MDVETAMSVVLETLHRATSQNAEVLKPAEIKLKEWETEPGFYSILLNIFSNHSIDVNVRWLAVLYFKNGIDRYWRKTAPNAISEVEKTSLREGLVSNFREPVNQLAIQLAVLISKVARFDCPREWPGLVTILLTAVRSEEELVQHRALLTLHHVMKVLSSKRLAGDRRIFQELTSNIFNFVLNLWNSHTESFLQASQSDDNMGRTLEKALLSLRVLRKLVVHGFKRPSEVEDAILFLHMVFDRMKTMLECRKTWLHNNHMREVCEKYIILLTKVLLDTLEHHPFSYVQFIRPTLEFTGFYIFTAAGEGLLFERFIIQCLNLIKGILLCAEYKPPKQIEDTKDPATLEAHRLKVEFFTTATLTEMYQKLVSHYFLFTHSDLELWDSDPEGFAFDEGGESWKYSLRPCTECLFLTLFHAFRETLSPVLLEMIEKNHEPVLPSDLNAILRKDAIYNAVGLAAFDLYDEVNFDQWFSTTLIEELKIKDPNYRVVRRRVIWLIGQWTGVKLSPELRPVLYEVILQLLRTEEDLVLRLTAANTLKLAIDDFEFSTEQFLPYLESAFGLLFSLLKETHECDIKMHVLHVLSFIIERVGVAIRPYTSALIQYLPLMWEESEDHNMLRCAILATLVHMVQGLGSVSESLASFLMPVIQLSTDVKQECHVYLLEDGLELWLATLENSASVTTAVLQLFQNMPPLLEYGSDNLRTCLYIVQAYILLCPEEFLKLYGSMVVDACNDMLSDLRSDGIVMVMRLLELTLRSSPRQATELFRGMLPRVFKAIYEGEEYPMVMSMYLSVISRVLLISQEAFSQVINEVRQNIGETSENVLGKILDVWCEKMPLVTQLERRKLLGLALTSLLTVGSSVVLERICAILLSIVEVLNDIVKTNDAGVQVDSLMIAEQELVQLDDIDYETEHDHRKRQLSLLDPVHTTILRDYLQSQISEMQVQYGAAHFEQLMQTVDIETMQQMQEHLMC